MSRQQILGAANALMLVLFSSWALFQYNDSDALLWFLVYGGAVVGILLFHYQQISSMPLWIYSGITFLWGAYMAVQFFNQPSLLMDDMPMLVEAGRELLGAWIVSGWMAFLARRTALRVYDGQEQRKHVDHT